MNGRNAPLSPVSLGDSDWPSGYPMDKDDPYAANNTRGPLVSPPNSGGPFSAAMNGFLPNGPSGPRTGSISSNIGGIAGLGGGPSPPPSIGRSSIGTNMYARSESGRSQREDNNEAVLGEHYVALKRFLSQTSRDGKPTAPANKARDKLQRLTGVQFLELSTDVFDELIRRQAFSRRPPNAPPNVGPPPYLMPEDSFHPKRNQARQKLASLGPPRFRDLATDVFCELERRYPNFSAGDIPRLDSPMSARGVPSRTGTPVNGGMNGMNGMGGMNGFPPRGQSRRRPSEAGSMRSMRNGGPIGPGMSNGGSVPPSPGLPPNGFDRPLQKQSQSNTIVPNKSTMVEEDDDSLISPTSNGTGTNMNGAMNGNGLEKSAAQSSDDKKLIDDYEAQIKDLREKMEAMEVDMGKKKEEMDALRDAERSQASVSNVEKQEWTSARRDLEDKLSEAQNTIESLQQEMDRMRSEHAAQERQLRAQIDELRQSLAESAQSSASRNGGSGSNDEELQRENEELRQALREQQDVTENVRQDAEQFLREMRQLSEQSGSTWEKQSELEKTIQALEAEARDWRNRYARAKTQLRSMRASSSSGLPMEEEASKYLRERGYTTDQGGMVKDVHVTKFQIAVDELLRIARVEEPEKTIDAMKAVVVSVRRITKDVDEAVATPREEENGSTAQQQQAKLKGRVSATANNLITAAKNYAMAAGLSPVSLLDAAASHLVAAVVELLRLVKIRSTPADELEDDGGDDGTMTPIESSNGFFSPPRRSNGDSQPMMAATAAAASLAASQNSLPPPPPFQGLGGYRDSADSSAYSPINSPRESVDRFGAASRLKKDLPLTPNGFGMGVGSQVDERTEDLKAFLDDQTATMVQTIQDMVGSIRGEAPLGQINGQINEIVDIVGKVIERTEASGHGGPTLDKLESCRQRLVEAADRGEEIAREGNAMQMRSWTTSLPPTAFEIARETKELVKRIDRLVLGDVGDDFS